MTSSKDAVKEAWPTTGGGQVVSLLSAQRRRELIRELDTPAGRDTVCHIISTQQSHGLITHIFRSELTDKLIIF